MTAKRYYLVWLIPLLAMSPAKTMENPAETLKQRSLETLRQALQTERGWPKVHAAEALLSVGDRVFLFSKWKQEKEDSWPGSTRIGYWRVSARCADESLESQKWIRRIEGAFTEEGSPFHLAALESLCKLSFHATGPTLQRIQLVAQDPNTADALFAYWALHLIEQQDALDRTIDALKSSDCKMRKLAAFVLNGAKCHQPNILAILADAADQEPTDSEAAPFLLSTAVALGANPTRESAWRIRLKEILSQGDSNSRYIICQTMAGHFVPSDIDSLKPLLDHPEADPRIGGALAILTLLQE